MSKTTTTTTIAADTLARDWRDGSAVSGGRARRR
jgi:hypothetical protein